MIQKIVSGIDASFALDAGGKFTKSDDSRAKGMFIYALKCSRLTLEMMKVFQNAMTKY